MQRRSTRLERAQSWGEKDRAERSEGKLAQNQAVYSLCVLVKVEPGTEDGAFALICRIDLTYPPGQELTEGFCKDVGGGDEVTRPKWCQSDLSALASPSRGDISPM